MGRCPFAPLALLAVCLGGCSPSDDAGTNTTAQSGPSRFFYNEPPLPSAPPERRQPETGQRLVIRGDEFHQCYVLAWANGQRFRFLIDTGSSFVAFGPQYLDMLGIEPSTLAFDRRISTANGIARAAKIRLREFRIGDFVLRDVPADIDEHGSLEPVLGAAVLKFLHLEFADGDCVLTLPEGAG
jgi:clan AA aspartic protease (TIGR02281 family)